MKFFRFALPALVAVAVLVTSSARLPAQDLQTLDLLVRKGLITQAEADAVAKSAAVGVTPRSTAVKKLQFGGMLQIQYDWLTTHDSAPGATPPPAVNQFMVRRANLEAISDLGNGWGGDLAFNFAAGAQRSAPPEAKPTKDNFKKVIIYKTFGGYGTATAGYQKVNWGQEENTASSRLKTIERSTVTFFFDGAYGGPAGGRLGFGAQHVGLYWDGVVPALDGFFYGAALTNGIQSVRAFGGVREGRAAFNQFGYWANAGYQGQYLGLGYRFGLNLGYGRDSNSTSGAVGVPSQNNAVYGYDPYVTLTYGGFTLSGEFMQVVVENGRVDALGVTSNAAPYGFIVSPSYQFTPEWELATRFSYLSTNGRGTAISPVVRNAQNTFDTVGFDNAWGLYIGFNYYIIGNAVELSAGYEYTRFLDREVLPGAPFDGEPASVSGLRTQLQVMF